MYRKVSLELIDDPVGLADEEVREGPELQGGVLLFLVAAGGYRVSGKVVKQPPSKG